MKIVADQYFEGLIRVESINGYDKFEMFSELRVLVILFSTSVASDGFNAVINYALPSLSFSLTFFQRKTNKIPVFILYLRLVTIGLATFRSSIVSSYGKDGVDGVSYRAPRIIRTIYKVEKMSLFRSNGEQNKKISFCFLLLHRLQRNIAVHR